MSLSSFAQKSTTNKWSKSTAIYSKCLLQWQSRWGSSVGNGVSIGPDYIYFPVGFSHLHNIAVIECRISLQNNEMGFQTTNDLLSRKYLVISLIVHLIDYELIRQTTEQKGLTKVILIGISS